MSEAASKYAQTPNVSVVDNRGLMIRGIGFSRRDADQVAGIVIGRNTYDERRRAVAAYDPRFSGLGQSEGTTPLATFSADAFDLSGTALRSRSLDKGEKIALANAAGQPVLAWDGMNTRGRLVYDDVGRVVATFELVAGETAEKVRERVVYGTKADTGLNLNGAAIRSYTSAGLQEVHSVGIAGGALRESFQLIEAKDSASDWQGESEADWQALLDRTGQYRFESAASFDASGAPLSSTDAIGNRLRSVYDQGGALSELWLQQPGQSEVQVWSGITRNADGLVVREEMANGIVSTFEYEPQTSLLVRSNATRSGSDVRFDHVYSYDPVGNLQTVEDQSVEVDYHRNTEVGSQRSYEYDSLYRLISASGREQDRDDQQRGRGGMSNIGIFGGTDPTRYRRYQQFYTYDDSNNLTRIRHAPSVGTGYTTNIVVSNRSNRGVKQDELQTITPDQVDSKFSAIGNPFALDHMGPLDWTASSQLDRVTIVQRNGGGEDDDYERYLYSGAGRVRKCTKVWVSVDEGIYEEKETIYLPRLELRRKWRCTVADPENRTLIEDLKVISVSAGRSSLRVLHWDAGQPESIEKNDQYRYSLDDHLGSSVYEFDGKGQILTFEEYYPFGGTAVSASKNEVEAAYKFVRFNGKEKDATGLYYYGYRYYISATGRWLNADPAEDGANFYQFCNGNPVNLVDPNGRTPLDPREILNPAAGQSNPNDTINASFQFLRDIATENPVLNIRRIRALNNYHRAQFFEPPDEFRARQAQSTTRFLPDEGSETVRAGLAYVRTLRGPVYTYSFRERADEQYFLGRARISGGAPNETMNAQGHFPRGPYATTIPPSASDVDLRAMRMSFFGPEYGLGGTWAQPHQDAIRNAISGLLWSDLPFPEEHGRTQDETETRIEMFQNILNSANSSPPDMSHYIEFLPPDRMRNRGNIVFPNVDSVFHGNNFGHYSAPEPSRNVGDLVPAHILRTGLTSIPERIPAVPGRGRSNSVINNRERTGGARPLDRPRRASFSSGDKW